MTKRYFKAVRYDYGSFYAPGFTYGPVGTVVEHPAPVVGSEYGANYISVSAEPADCTGFRWRVDGKDSRLLVVEPVGR